MTGKAMRVAVATAILLTGTPGWTRQAAPTPTQRPAPAQTPPSGAVPRPRMPIPASALLPATSALFDAYVRDRRMAGIVGGFGVGDAPTLFVDAGTIAQGGDAPAAGPDTLWRIYSMTKPITGMAVMMLVEDGKLTLDQPLSSVFPQYARMTVAVAPETSAETRPARGAITIRHLLTHSGGLGYSITAKGPLLKQYERLGLLPFAASAQTEAIARAARPSSLIAFAERAAQVPLVADPGTRWSYSMGLDIAAAVVERVSGMPFERFVQTRLFDPLRMRSTFWRVPADATARLATNYAYLGDTAVVLDPGGAASVFAGPPSFPYGGAGLVSSARDYDRFLHMLANGGTLEGVRVMKAETVATALSNLLPAGVAFRGMGGEGVAMGFGAGGSVTLADTPGMGKGTYGWGGAAGTIAWVDPSRGVRGTVMVNYFPAERVPLRRDVAAALATDARRLHGGMPGTPGAR